MTQVGQTGLSRLDPVVKSFVWREWQGLMRGGDDAMGYLCCKWPKVLSQVGSWTEVSGRVSGGLQRWGNRDVTLRVGCFV